MLFDSSLSPPPPPPPTHPSLSSLTLDEVQDEAAAKEGVGHESSDEGLGREMDSNCDEDDDEERLADCLLGDSGYGGQSMEELGSDAFFVSLEAVAQIPCPPASAP